MWYIFKNMENYFAFYEWLIIKSDYQVKMNDYWSISNDRLINKLFYMSMIIKIT